MIPKIYDIVESKLAVYYSWFKGKLTVEDGVEEHRHYIKSHKDTIVFKSNDNKKFYRFIKKSSIFGEQKTKWSTVILYEHDTIKALEMMIKAGKMKFNPNSSTPAFINELNNLKEFYKKTKEANNGCN